MRRRSASRATLMYSMTDHEAGDASCHPGRNWSGASIQAKMSWRSTSRQKPTNRRAALNPASAATRQVFQQRHLGQVLLGSCPPGALPAPAPRPTSSSLGLSLSVPAGWRRSVVADLASDLAQLLDSYSSSTVRRRSLEARRNSPSCFTDRAADLRQLARAEEQQRNNKDENQFRKSDRAEHTTLPRRRHEYSVLKSRSQGDDAPVLRTFLRGNRRRGA